MEKDNQIVSVDLGAGNHIQLINEKVIGIRVDDEGFAIGWVKWTDTRVIPVITWAVNCDRWIGDFQFMKTVENIKAREEN